MLTLYLHLAGSRRDSRPVQASGDAKQIEGIHGVYTVSAPTDGECVGLKTLRSFSATLHGMFQRAHCVCV